MLYIYVEGNYVGGGNDGTGKKYLPTTHQLNNNEGIVLSNICSYIQV
jgi:hypothetical protein